MTRTISKARVQGLLWMFTLAPAGVAWAAPGDPIHGVDVKLGFDGGALIETSPVSAVRGGAVAILSPRDAASGLPTGKRQHKPIVFTSITLERAVGKSTVWRDHASGLPTGKRQHKPIYIVKVTGSGDQGGELRSITWHECFLTDYAVIETTDPGGKRIAVEQITVTPTWAQLSTASKGGAPPGTLAVDLDGDGAPDLAASHQALTHDPTVGFPAGDSKDPSLLVHWIVDGTGPSVGFFQLLNGIIGPGEPKERNGIIGPKINAVVTDTGKPVDEFPGMRLCGYVPPQLGDEASGIAPPATDRVVLCAPVTHF